MARTEDVTKNYELNGGELFVKMPTDTNFQYFAEVDELKMKTNKEFLEHFSSETNILVKNFKMLKKASATISLTTKDLKKEVLALAFDGEFETTSQSSGSVSDEEINGVKNSYLYDLANKKVSNVVVKYEDGDDDKEAVEGVDYRVDYDFGTLEITNNSAVDGKDIKVDYDYGEIEVTKISTLNKTDTNVSLLFVSAPQRGKKKRILFHKVKLSMNGDFDLKKLDDVKEIAFEGEVLIDLDKPEGEQFFKVEELG